MVPGVDRPARPAPGALRQLAGLYLKLGTIAFGGPAAHVAMMEDEIVQRRRWLSREQFLDLLGAANLLPGPSSTELAIYIGLWRAGWPGLIVAGFCFILPAFLMVTVLAAIYDRFGGLPSIVGILCGIKPVVIAIVLQALVRLGRQALKTRSLAVLGLVCTALALFDFSPLALLVGAGMFSAGLWQICQRPGRRAALAGPDRPADQPDDVPATPPADARPGIMPVALPALLAAKAGAAAVPAAALGSIFLAFLKLGCVVFGSGYVLLVFLRDDLVTRNHWLTESQLLDAVAVGQVTPGPVFTTATFIGYMLGARSGAPLAGAALATLAIFLPAFLLVGITGPAMRRLRRSPAAGAFLDGLNVAATALMAVVTWQLAQSALVDATTIALALASLAALLAWRLNSAWLIAAGALAGWIATAFHAA